MLDEDIKYKEDFKVKSCLITTKDSYEKIYDNDSKCLLSTIHNIYKEDDYNRIVSYSAISKEGNIIEFEYNYHSLNLLVIDDMVTLEIADFDDTDNNDKNNYFTYFGYKVVKIIDDSKNDYIEYVLQIVSICSIKEIRDDIITNNYIAIKYLRKNISSPNYFKFEFLKKYAIKLGNGSLEDHYGLPENSIGYKRINELLSSLDANDRKAKQLKSYIITSNSRFSLLEDIGG